MTSTPSLPAQIEAVRDVLDSYEAMAGSGATRSVILWRAVLVTLQQHERLEAAARRYCEATEAGEEAAIRGGLYGFLRAAIDTAAPDKPEDAEREHG